MLDFCQQPSNIFLAEKISRNKIQMDDFNQLKIIYPETTQGAFFVFDKKGIFLDKTCFMMVSKYAEFLQSVLSSKLYEFAYKKIYSSVEIGASGYQYNKHALLKLPILFDDNIVGHSISKEELYLRYHLSSNEIIYIESSLDE